MIATQKYINDELKKWQDGVYGAKELIEMNIIDEYDGFEDEDDGDGDHDGDDDVDKEKEQARQERNFKTSSIVRECVEEQLCRDEQMFEKESYNQLMTQLLKYNQSEEMIKQTKINVNCINMNPSAQTMVHFKNHVRIGEKRIEGDEEDIDGMYNPMQMFMSSLNDPYRIDGSPLMNFNQLFQ